MLSELGDSQVINPSIWHNLECLTTVKLTLSVIVRLSMAFGPKNDKPPTFGVWESF